MCVMYAREIQRSGVSFDRVEKFGRWIDGLFGYGVLFGSIVARARV